MKYFVSRQHYWGGPRVVEVAGEGLDYSGPDMLSAHYGNLGEGKEYDNPVEAVEAAIRIREQWQADVDAIGNDMTHYEIEGIAVGFTHGMFSQLEPVDNETAREWARTAYESLPKCTQCGELLPDDEWYEDDDGNKFEREYCLEEYHKDDLDDPNVLWERYKENGYGACPRCDGVIRGGGYDYEKDTRSVECATCGLEFYEVKATIGIGLYGADGATYESDSVTQIIE